MKSKFVGVVAVVLWAGMALGQAQVASSFEATSNGNYVDGASVFGKNDTSLGGTWAQFGSTNTDAGTVTSSSVEPKDGLLSVRVAHTVNNATALGAKINATNASSLLSSAFEFKISINVQTISTPTSGGQVQLYFGADVVGDDNHWLRLTVNSSNADLSLATVTMVTGTGTGTFHSVSLGRYTDFAPGGLGNYLDFDVKIDVATHLYTSVLINGIDRTSVIQASDGGMIPWKGTTPGSMLNGLTGSNDVATVDFDAVSITAVPEPSSLVLVGLGVCGLLGWRRRVRRA